MLTDFLHKRELRMEAEAKAAMPVAELTEKSESDQEIDIDNKLVGAVESVRWGRSWKQVIELDWWENGFCIDTIRSLTTSVYWLSPADYILYISQIGHSPVRHFKNVS